MSLLKLCPGLKVGHWLLIEEDHQPKEPPRWKCRCDCGRELSVLASNLSRDMSNSCGKCTSAINRYCDCPDGVSVAVHVNGIQTFYITKTDEPLVMEHVWYVSGSIEMPQIITAAGIHLHRLIMGEPNGLEVDHIDRNRFNNRRSNLRVCTHQQNQCNQGLQRNNSSGFAGVRFYKARDKYVSRIKFFQLDIHLTMASRPQLRGFAGIE